MKKNPADLTSRNNNARKNENMKLKRRVEALENKVRILINVTANLLKERDADAVS